MRRISLHSSNGHSTSACTVRNRLSNLKTEEPISNHTYHKEVLYGQQLVDRVAELKAEGITIDRMVSPENGVYHVEYRRVVKVEHQSELVL